MNPISYESCTLCHRHCKVNRTLGQHGYCQMTNELVVARAALHYWEEPCISGSQGSGTLFFSGCSLRCVFCQNHDIAIAKTGKVISTTRLTEIFLELQEKGANNINLVTPTHFVPTIKEALLHAKSNGLSLPIVYNTGTYDTVETLKSLDGLIDIYLPDLKYYSSDLSSRYSNAPDYFSCATSAIQEMYRQVTTPIFENNIMKRGMIVRHLALPHAIKDSKKILSYLWETYRDNIYVSIMNQYTPLSTVSDYPEINRPLTNAEYNRLIDYALELGYTNAYIQEGETALESFIPPFTCEGI